MKDKITSFKLNWYDCGLCCADQMVQEEITVYRNNNLMVFKELNGYGVICSCEIIHVENNKVEEFFDFMKSRVKVLPYGTSKDWFGCFPMIENDILTDIRLLVPKIETRVDLLINIHEYYHALELFNELGTIYEPKTEESIFYKKQCTYNPQFKKGTPYKADRCTYSKNIESKNKEL